MGEHRVSVIEGIVQRVEGRIAERYRHDAALKAEASERERLLGATMKQEETHRGSPENGSAEGDTPTHQGVFVVVLADALQDFSPGRDRLLSVIPAREGGGGMGLRGSWLVLEKG